MFDDLRIKYNQFREAAREKSLQDALKRALATLVQVNRVVVPVYNDLSKLKPAKTEESSALQFMVIDQANAGSAAAMNKVASRRLKGSYNTGSGYYAYAVVANGEIVGDIWCATPGKVSRRPLHPDLWWLGIECGDDEAYMFDMYVAPDSRGKVITSYLLTNALEHLKRSGFRRVYGFYDKANLPALWIHRMFGYTELAKRKVTRIVFYKKSEALPAAE